MVRFSSLLLEKESKEKEQQQEDDQQAGQGDEEAPVELGANRQGQQAGSGRDAAGAEQEQEEQCGLVHHETGDELIDVQVHLEQARDDPPQGADGSRAGQCEGDWQGGGQVKLRPELGSHGRAQHHLTGLPDAEDAGTEGNRSREA